MRQNQRSKAPNIQFCSMQSIIKVCHEKNSNVIVKFATMVHLSMGKTVRRYYIAVTEFERFCEIHIHIKHLCFLKFFTQPLNAQKNSNKTLLKIPLMSGFCMVHPFHRFLACIKQQALDF